MLKTHQNATNLGILGGVLLKLPAMMCIMLQQPPLVVLSLLAASLLCFVWGCSAFAAGKGYNRALGALGLLSFLGLMVLVLLPDRFPDGEPRAVGHEELNANTGE